MFGSGRCSRSAASPAAPARPRSPTCRARRRPPVDASRCWSPTRAVRAAGWPRCAGVEVPRSLPRARRSSSPPGVSSSGGIYATGRDGLRVLATGPEFASRPRGRAAREAAARRARGARADRDRLRHARPRRRPDRRGRGDPHRLGPARDRARRRSAAAGARRRAPTGRQRAARRPARRAPDKAPLRELRQIAAERHAPLCSCPHLPASRRRDVATRGRGSAGPGAGDPRSAAAMISHRPHPRRPRANVSTSVVPTAQLRAARSASRPDARRRRSGSRGGSPPC